MFVRKPQTPDVIQIPEMRFSVSLLNGRFYLIRSMVYKQRATATFISLRLPKDLEKSSTKVSETTISLVQPKEGDVAILDVAWFSLKRSPDMTLMSLGLMCGIPMGHTGG